MDVDFLTYLASVLVGMTPLLWMVVATVVIVGTIGGAAWVSHWVADSWHWGWNFIVVPVILFAGFVALIFIDWIVRTTL